MSQYISDASAPVFLEKYDQLVALFEEACKPRQNWRIGTEYEKVAVWQANGQAVPFTNGIEEVLRRLAERYDWKPVHEDGRLVALSNLRASITLEPGAQLELSGEQCESVHCAQHELAEHIEQIVGIGNELGIAFLGLGMQPLSTLEEIDWVPKKRYGIMGPYMLKTGTLGQRMMKQTATVQVNIDYGSERDAMLKMRAGMGLAPLFTAMFANSPFCDGGLNSYLSYRAHIWTDTDNDRCGLLPFLFGDTPGFADYVDWALDVPMYFIVRGDRWTDMTSYTFRRFWQEGYGEERATIADWNAHMTTLFPEARMKGYIEMRSIDSQSPELMLAVPALIKGIFYNDDCLLAAWDLVKRWSLEERTELADSVHRQALRARIRGISVQEIAKELVAIAETGLTRQASLNTYSENETLYLERLRDNVHKGRSPADLLVDKWLGDWDRDVSRMVAGSSYRVAA